MSVAGFLRRIRLGEDSIIRFDESVVPATARSDLHDSLTRRFLAGDVADDDASNSAGDALPGASEDDLLRKLRIVADDADGRARLTLAGVLLCTEEPQRWLSHAYVQAVSYAGERTDADYQTDARDIGGSLDQQVAESLHFVRRNMLVRATKETARVERLLDEAGVAIAHILADGHLEPHAETMDRLLAAFDLNPNGDLLQPREEVVAHAIALQARRVGYVSGNRGGRSPSTRDSPS